VILQKFNAYKITGEASELRQEFRELEILDNITTLHYNGKLPTSVVGIGRWCNLRRLHNPLFKLMRTRIQLCRKQQQLSGNSVSIRLIFPICK